MLEDRYELAAGDKIPMRDGSFAVVEEKIGSGGQGAVYKVHYQGKKWALKWYFYEKIKHPHAFRNNLSVNIKEGAPENSDKFLWPKHLTEYVSVKGKYKTFGYLMDLAPAGYVELEKIYGRFEWKKPKVKGQKAIQVEYKFASLDAQVTAAINIVKAFRVLHLVGKSYQDLNLSGFFVNPQSGDVLICDCDNVAPDGENFGIGGYPGFMAPEIVRGVAKPDVLTDRYSLANVLFRLFMRSDPLEGKKVLQSVVLTEANDLKHYGKESLFIFDPNDASNCPVLGVHDNAIKLWKLYPPYIKEAFVKSFTAGLKNPNERIIEKTWQNLLIRLRSDIVHCTCGKVAYTTAFKHEEHFICTCSRCGSKIYTLQMKDMTAPLYPGLKLYRCYTEDEEDYETVTGEVIENKEHKGMFGIKNLSDKVWKAKFPDNEIHEVKPEYGVPIWKGLLIDFGNGIGGRILS